MFNRHEINISNYYTKLFIAIIYLVYKITFKSIINYYNTIRNITVGFTQHGHIGWIQTINKNIFIQVYTLLKICNKNKISFYSPDETLIARNIVLGYFYCGFL
jgi:hypothetical protein